METIREARAWLSRAWRIEAEIEAIEEARARALARVMSMTKTADKKPSRGKTSSRGDGRLVEYVEYSELLDRHIARLNVALLEISDAIFNVTDPILRTVLVSRYLAYPNDWVTIAKRMRCSESQVRNRLHPRALREIKNCVHDV